MKWYCKSGLNVQYSKHWPRVFTTILNIADAESQVVRAWAEMALKSDFKPKLEIVYSVSLWVSSLLQSQQASAPELASQNIGLKVSNPSSAQLAAVAGGDMDQGQRILQGPCGSTRAPKSPVTRNHGVYGWPDAQRWHSHCGPCGEVESRVKAAPGQLSLGYPSLVPDSGSSDRAGTRGSWGYSLCGVWNWAG